MKQFSIETDDKKQEVKTPTSTVKFEIPDISNTLEKIEEAQVIEEEEPSNEELGMMAALFAAVFGARIRAKRQQKANDEELEKEMEKIHPRIKSILKGCGCGM